MILSAVVKFAPKLLPVLGKLFKGKATIVGDVLVAAGTAAVVGSPHIITDQNAVALLHEVGLIVTAFGGVISAFGFGRKAGAAGS